MWCWNFFVFQNGIISCLTQNAATFNISLIPISKSREEPPASFVGSKILWLKKSIFFCKILTLYRRANSLGRITLCPTKTFWNFLYFSNSSSQERRGASGIGLDRLWNFSENIRLAKTTRLTTSRHQIGKNVHFQN